MSEIYSDADDCLDLARYLKTQMGRKISFYGSTYQEVISGSYFSDFESKCCHVYGEGLAFYYKFCKEGFLRIGIGSFPLHNNSVGEKLAALSSFYEALSEQYGEPTFFYTIKDDDEGTLSLQWSFANKEEDIQNLRSGNYFDDGEIDELIVIDEPRTQMNSYELNDTTKKFNANKIGIPCGLIDLVNENIDDFVKYKTGKEIGIPEGTKIDGVSVTSFQKKISLK